jgi:hypothetical protein
MKGSLVRLPLCRTQWHRTKHLLLHFHATSMMMPRTPPFVAPSPVLRQNWDTMARLASRRSKPPDVDVCHHTFFIHSSVLRHKPINLLPLGFVAQTKKSSQWFWGLNHQTVDLGFEPQTKKLSHWFWGQTTNKPSLVVLRLNRETTLLVSSICMLWIAHGVTRPLDLSAIEYLTCAWSSPILRTKSPTPASLNPHRCPPCCIRHLHITRQANVFLHTE